MRARGALVCMCARLSVRARAPPRRHADALGALHGCLHVDSCTSKTRYVEQARTPTYDTRLVVAQLQLRG